MFSRDIYVARRQKLKERLNSGILLFLGNELSAMNYVDNTYTFRQDSTFLYYFGIDQEGLTAMIDLDNDKDIIFGDELSIDHIIWMGNLPTLKERAEAVGAETSPAASLGQALMGRQVHYLPPYRPEHEIKLSNWLGKSLSEVNAGGFGRDAGGHW